MQKDWRRLPADSHRWRGTCGAVATGLFDEKSQRASSSVVTMPGHREEYLALHEQDRLARQRKEPLYLLSEYIKIISALRR